MKNFLFCVLSIYILIQIFISVVSLFFFLRVITTINSMNYEKYLYTFIHSISINHDLAYLEYAD